MQERYTAVEAARAVNVSEATIRNYIRSGKLHAEKDGTSWAIRRNELEAVFGYVMEITTEEGDPPESENRLMSASDPSESFTALVDAATRPVSEMMEILRAQLEAKDKRIAELEAQIAALQGQIASLTEQAMENAASQAAIWQEFVRANNAQLAAITGQLSQTTQRPEPPRRGGIFRWLSR